MPPSPDATDPTRPLRAEPTDFERLATIRFPLIVLLVFLHNDRGAEFSARLQAAPFHAAIVDALSQGLGGIRVPAFFLVGGYAFFLAMKPSAAAFARKIRSRIRSLLVPLVAWNLLGLFGLALAQQLPFVSSLLTPHSAWAAPLSEFGAAQWAMAVFGTPHAQPFIYPLWFLRDLFVLVLLSPAIWWLIRSTRGWATLVVVAGWAAGVHPSLVAADAFAFYVVGCHVAIARKSLFALDRVGPAAAVAWLLLQAGPVHGQPEWHQLKSVLGVVAVLGLSGWLARRAAPSRWMNVTAPYSFFIFVAHEPLLTFTRKAWFATLHPASPAQWLTAYLGSTALVLGVLIVAFEVAKRVAPRALWLLTGGRSPRPVALHRTTPPVISALETGADRRS